MVHEDNSRPELEAFAFASEELQEAEDMLRMAEIEWNRVRSIPKGKAGGGKGAKNEASNKLREAKQRKEAAMDQLKVAKTSLTELQGDPAPEPDLNVEKRVREDSSEDAGITKKPRLSTTEANPDSTPSLGDIEKSGDEENQIDRGSADIPVGPVSIPEANPDSAHSLGDSEKSGNEENRIDQGSAYIPGDLVSVPEANPDSAPSLSDIEKSGDEENQINRGSADIRGDDYASESSMSIFSETDTENEDDEGLPLYVSDTDEEVPGDADRRAYAEKYVRNPELKPEDQKLYRFLDEDAKKNWDANGRNGIKAFLAEGKVIDPSVRRMARVDPTYLPEAASTSQRLAIHFLTSNDGNIQCAYHAFKNKSTLVRDGWGKEGMQLKGVPGKKKNFDGKKKKILDGKKKNDKDASEKKKAGLLLRPAKGLGNCGCRLEDILLEFILSKRLKIRGMVRDSRLEEMMMGTQDYLEPRDRSFAFEAIRSQVSCFSLNDFFLHDNTWGMKQQKIQKKRIRYEIDVLNSIYRADRIYDDDFKELVVLSRRRLRELQAKEIELEKWKKSLPAGQ